MCAVCVYYIKYKTTTQEVGILYSTRHTTQTGMHTLEYVYNICETCALALLIIPLTWSHDASPASWAPILEVYTSEGAHALPDTKRLLTRHRKHFVDSTCLHVAADACCRMLILHTRRYCIVSAIPLSRQCHCTRIACTDRRPHLLQPRAPTAYLHVQPSTLRFHQIRLQTARASWEAGAQFLPFLSLYCAAWLGKVNCTLEHTNRFFSYCNEVSLDHTSARIHISTCENVHMEYVEVYSVYLCRCRLTSNWSCIRLKSISVPLFRYMMSVFTVWMDGWNVCVRGGARVT